MSFPCDVGRLFPGLNIFLIVDSRWQETPKKG